MHVMTQLLGERSCNLRGLGELPRLKTGAKRATPRASPSRQPTITQEEYEQQMIQLANVFLGFNMPAMPLILPVPPFQPLSYATGSSSQTAHPGDENDTAVDV
uniref:Uncharacterized protein n=1 Tax=Cannabis sativa TaxID=3483 RepID=A0A803NSN0_CANSA